MFTAKWKGSTWTATKGSSGTGPPPSGNTGSHCVVCEEENSQQGWPPLKQPWPGDLRSSFQDANCSFQPFCSLPKPWWQFFFSAFLQPPLDLLFATPPKSRVRNDLFAPNWEGSPLSHSWCYLTVSSYSRCGSWISSTDLTWELIRNADCQAPSPNSWIRICILTRCPTGLCARSVWDVLI